MDTFAKPDTLSEHDYKILHLASPKNLESRATDYHDLPLKLCM